MFNLNKVFSLKRLVFSCVREINYNIEKIKDLESFVKNSKYDYSYAASDVMAKRALGFFSNFPFRGHEYDNNVYEDLLRKFSNTLNLEEHFFPDKNKIELVKELSSAGPAKTETTSFPTAIS